MYWMRCAWKLNVDRKQKEYDFNSWMSCGFVLFVYISCPWSASLRVALSILIERERWVVNAGQAATLKLTAWTDFWCWKIKRPHPPQSCSSSSCSSLDTIEHSAPWYQLKKSQSCLPNLRVRAALRLTSNSSRLQKFKRPLSKNSRTVESRLLL